MDWIQRGRFVMQQLQSVAQSSQKNVRAYLDSNGISYRSFWIDNVILVEEFRCNRLRRAEALPRDQHHTRPAHREADRTRFEGTSQN